jgi:minor extracellular serine protease Vpr
MKMSKLENGFLKLSLAGLCALASSGCRPGAPSPSEELAINSRPQSYDRFIATAKLMEPALLDSATEQESKLVVSEEAKAAIEAEQLKFISEISKLSSEIQVLHRFKLVLNAVVVVGPKHLEDEFRGMSAIAEVESDGGFSRPEVNAEGKSRMWADNIATINSAAFIGAKKAHEELTVLNSNGEAMPLRGQGMRVGVLDTGIDYTHKMFGGEGTIEAFKANNPSEIESGSFPTAKVVGGIDLVGTEYNAASPNFSQHIPKPDADPIDEGGHGSHVAGTVAGVGDGVNSYDGVAPEAKLYSIKVFGADGSTSTAVVVAGLEYSADPDADLNPSDRLDVVNLSLGSSFGSAQNLYAEAMKNLTRGGTLVVASGGNSGHMKYIVGSPGTSDAALSVAASIDNMDHNYKFGAVSFVVPGSTEPITSEKVEASFSKPVAEAGEVSGALVHLGTAHVELTEEQKVAVRGKVALIDRGIVTFFEKAKRAADAGAIGVVVANNRDGDAPFQMGGGSEKLEIPAVMISKELGTRLKQEMQTGDAVINFKTDLKIEKPWLIDTLTSFSSRGPRSLDSAIKPEVAAPGQSIISAKMGGGDEGEPMSGTSMAAPHVAGLAALVRQYRPDLDPMTIKSMIVGSTVRISNQDKVYPVSQQGSGRVRVVEAATAKVVANPPTLSLGEVLIETSKTFRSKLSLKNISSVAQDVDVTAEVKEGLEILGLKKIQIPANSSVEMPLTVKLTAPKFDDAAVELDGVLKISTSESGSQIVVPVLAVARKATRIQAKSLTVSAGSPAEASGALATVEITNKGKTSGEIQLFNLIGRDERAASSARIPSKNTACDLEAVGYRLAKQQIGEETVDVVEFGIKLFKPVTSWDLCEVSIQLDADGDGVADQELVGETRDGKDTESVLYDAAKLRSLRSEFETSFPKLSKPDYVPAELARIQATGYRNSTVAVVAVRADQIARTAAGLLKAKIAVLGDPDVAAFDDFLKKDSEKWQSISLSAADLGYSDIPAKLTIEAGETIKAELVVGGGRHSLMALMPHNRSSLGELTRDEQFQLIKPRYQ